MMSQENQDSITSLIDSVRALKEELANLEDLLSSLYIPNVCEYPVAHEPN